MIAITGSKFLRISSGALVTICGVTFEKSFYVCQ
jgi:hypothetical protein